MTIRRAAQFVYNRTVRDHLPNQWIVRNRVAVRDRRMLDITSHDPCYEEELITAIHHAVGEDDHVCIVGGGKGVSTVWASRESRSGHVDVYEAAAEQVGLVAETVEANPTPAPVALHHAVVGPGIDIWGDAGDADHIQGTHLPDCDVLVVDAEGAETSILRTLAHQPREIVVEYHNQFGVSRADTEAELDGYDILSHGIEDEEKGVGIIHARRCE